MDKIFKRFGPCLLLVGVLLLVFAPLGLSETNDDPAGPADEEPVSRETTISQAAPMIKLLDAIKEDDSDSLKSVWSKRMIARWLIW